MNETMMTLVERRSVRKYKKDSIPQELLDEVLKAGIYAPTARGMQDPEIVVIQNKDVIARLTKLNAKIMGNVAIDPFYGAPVILMVIGHKEAHNTIYDGSCVIDNMLNAAYSVGLGSCWIHRAKEELDTEEGREILKLAGIENPEDYIGIGHVILGYPEGNLPPAKPRKENRVHYIK